MKKIALIIAVSLASIGCYATEPEVERCDALLRKMLTEPEIANIDRALTVLKSCMERHALIQETFGQYCGSPFALDIAVKLNAAGFKFSQQLLQHCNNSCYLIIDKRNSLPEGSAGYNQLDTILKNAKMTTEFVKQTIKEQKPKDLVQE